MAMAQSRRPDVIELTPEQRAEWERPTPWAGPSERPRESFWRPTRCKVFWSLFWCAVATFTPLVVVGGTVGGLLAGWVFGYAVEKEDY